MPYKDKNKALARGKAYYNAHKDELREKAKKYYLEHSQEIQEKRKRPDGSGKDYKERRNEKLAKYYQANKERLIEKGKAYREANKGKIAKRLRGYNQTLPARFTHYKNGAKQRGLTFDLTREEFAQHWQKPCFYCGDEIAAIGLDRRDNTQGYNKDNVVPCCATCNFMKNSKTFDEFTGHCFRIADHLRKDN